jgi:nucleotidyltransferase substrate binding protein (TIGR01987 family)
MKQNKGERLSHTLKNFERSLKSMEKALATPVTEERDLAGIIQNFEFVYELSWKVLKQRLEGEGFSIGSPKQAFKKAFQSGLIKNEKTWLDILDDRNLTVHTYDEELARRMYEDIRSRYLKEFQDLLRTLKP